MAGQDLPEWWDWPLELSPHVLKRMADRGFTEADLRTMLEDAQGISEDAAPGRWLVETQHHGEPWEVIVEPDDELETLVVVTAYKVD